MTDKLNMVDVRIWCGALVHHGKPYLKAWFYEHWDYFQDKLKRTREIRVVGAPEVVAVEADEIDGQTLLHWWEKTVCEPRGVHVDLVAIHRRRLKLYELLDEAEELDGRIKNICMQMGESAPSHIVRHICEHCLGAYDREYNEPSNAVRTIGELEAQAADDLRRCRAIRKNIRKRRTRASGQ